MRSLRRRGSLGGLLRRLRRLLLRDLLLLGDALELAFRQRLVARRRRAGVVPLIPLAAGDRGARRIACHEVLAALERHRALRGSRGISDELAEHRVEIAGRRAEELVDDGVRDLRPGLLVRDDHGRETLHEFLLDLAAQHGAAAVRLADRPQLVVVVHEEIEPLPADVHLQVAALLPVLLDREPPAAERVLVHLVLDLLRGVRDVDGGRGVGRGHLSALALQRREESRLDERGLVSADAGRSVSGHAKVRVLVDGARDEASKRLLVGAEEVREAVGERGRRLRGREADLPDVGLAGEAEDAARLVERDALGDLQHVEVEGGAHVVDVGEDERAPGVESARDDVLGVLPRQPPGVLELHGLPQELLVVGELDDERHLESLLEPLGEVEGDEVAEVQGL
mmetsp:Transcript_4771/g.17846  ORF Transcript_4771/g.17846 Transcript_4771/m.17846 type:complete len:397 (+) Transcript_4771:649-1839(+)